ncbi:MAG: hypothetical protein AAGF96_05915 [Bacteroidota bacterium]
MDYVENAFTVAAGQATEIDAGVTEVFEYALRADANNQLVQALVSNKDTGVTVNTETLNVRLQKLDAATNVQVSIMSKGRPIVVVQDRAGNYHVVGMDEGLDLTASNIATGAQREDFSGYDLTFTGKREDACPILDSTTVTALLALVSNTNIDP